MFWPSSELLGIVCGGEDEDRTHDLRIANAALSQLSYPPNVGAILYHPDPLIKANAPDRNRSREALSLKCGQRARPRPIQEGIMSTHDDIGDKTCKPCAGEMARLDEAACRDYLGSLAGWALAGAAI